MDYFNYLQIKPVKQEQLGLGEDKQLVQVTKVDGGGVRIPVLNSWLAGGWPHPSKGSLLARHFFFTFSHWCKSSITHLSDSMSTDSSLNLPKVLISSCTVIITHVTQSFRKNPNSHTPHSHAQKDLTISIFQGSLQAPLPPNKPSTEFTSYSTHWGLRLTLV